MLRSVGAILFGIASDRYGRKWPFIVNNIMFIVLELGTGFCTTYEQFLVSLSDDARPAWSLNLFS